MKCLLKVRLESKLYIVSWENFRKCLRLQTESLFIVWFMAYHIPAPKKILEMPQKTCDVY
jgi:hypothetical protein